MPLTRAVPGRPGRLVELDERLDGLGRISSVCSTIFAEHLDPKYVDLQLFGLGPALEESKKESNAYEEEDAVGATARRADDGEKRRVVTGEAAVKAIRFIRKSKETARVRECAAIIYRALVYGDSDARSASCSDEAAQVLVKLVAGGLPVFEYEDLANGSRTMSARDWDRAKVGV